MFVPLFAKVSTCLFLEGSSLKKTAFSVSKFCSEGKFLSSPMRSKQFHIAILCYYAFLLMGSNFLGYIDSRVMTTKKIGVTQVSRSSPKGNIFCYAGKQQCSIWVHFSCSVVSFEEMRCASGLNVPNELITDLTDKQQMRQNILFTHRTEWFIMVQKSLPVLWDLVELKNWDHAKPKSEAKGQQVKFS